MIQFQLFHKLKIVFLYQIGENPAYFIVKQTHKSRKELLSNDIWDDLGGI